MAILNPESGLPFVQESLIAELKYWLTKQPILDALVKSGYASRVGLIHLAAKVIATETQTTGAVKPLSELDTAELISYFLTDRQVRKAIARQMIHDGRADKKQAVRGLMEFRIHVEKEYNLLPSEPVV